MKKVKRNYDNIPGHLKSLTLLQMHVDEKNDLRSEIEELQTELAIKDDMIKLLQEHLDNFVEMKKRLRVETAAAEVMFAAIPNYTETGILKFEKAKFIEILQGILGKERE